MTYSNPAVLPPGVGKRAPSTALRPAGAATPRTHPAPGDRWSSVAGRCPRGVALLGATAEGTAHVITTATFGVVSVAPPLVSLTVAAGGRSRRLIEAAGRFAVSLLSGTQEWLAQECARPGRPAGWGDLPAASWWAGPASGAPLVRGAPAWVDCRLHCLLDLAGQVLVVGTVEHAGEGPSDPPLLRFAGAYYPLLPAADLRTPEGGDPR